MQKQHVARMSISVPQPDVNSLATACWEMKQAIEQMAGRYNEPGFGYRARMTVQDQPPTIERDGEFWLSTGATNVLSVSLGGKWRMVGPVT